VEEIPVGGESAVACGCFLAFPAMIRTPVRFIITSTSPGCWTYREQLIKREGRLP